MFNSIEKLRWLLRVLSGICLLALIAVVMPDSWMIAAHEAMGLGPFPSAPIAEYLARSTSALSAFYGGLLWVLSRDVVRYASIIRYQAAAMLCLSTSGLLIGRAAGIPMIWVAIDASGCWLFCLPTLVLAWNVESRHTIVSTASAKAEPVPDSSHQTAP